MTRGQPREGSDGQERSLWELTDVTYKQGEMPGELDYRYAVCSEDKDDSWERGPARMLVIKDPAVADYKAFKASK